MKYNVCIQGLGFVGSAMAVAVAKAASEKYNVVGIDLDTAQGSMRVKKINQGLFPFEITDESLKNALSQAIRDKKLKATHDITAYKVADIIVMSVPFDLDSLTDDNPKSNWEPLIEASKQIAQLMQPSCLVILQSTVLPGTIRKKILPVFQTYFKKRDIKSTPLLAYSYERVMPGKDYLNSIVNNYRCYSALNQEAEERCHAFFSDIINIKDFPLLKMTSVEAAELAKIMENSFRALNIAFIEEWAQFSETAGIDLNEVIRAIRMRETHKNIAQPGFGVGGYCLTKDPLFIAQSAKELYGLTDANFPFCRLAVQTNQNMPLRCLKRLEECLGDLNNKKILLAGVSYKSDVGDVRCSPSIPFYHEATQKGALIKLTDPLADSIEGLIVEKDINKFKFNEFHAVVFAVSHPQYRDKRIVESILNTHKSVLVFDACNLLDTLEIRGKMKDKNIYIIGSGRVV